MVSWAGVLFPGGVPKSGEEIRSLHTHQGKAERPCRGTHFTVQRGKRKVAPLGKLKVGSVIHRELEKISQAQRFAPGVHIRLVVYGNVQERHSWGLDIDLM
jgi:hypothetical protein